MSHVTFSLFFPFLPKFLYLFFNRNTKIITVATATPAPTPISRMKGPSSGGGEEVGLCEGEVVGVAVGSDVVVEVGVGERVGDGSPMMNLYNLPSEPHM